MINRPSYAQRTLEITRHSLQSVPSDLRPLVSGTHPCFGAAAEEALRAEAASCRSAQAPMARLIDLQRWRRKSAPAPQQVTEATLADRPRQRLVVR